MAKKTAPKKKTTAAKAKAPKAKTAKAVKPTKSTKPKKLAKSVIKAVKTVVKAFKPSPQKQAKLAKIPPPKMVKPVKPALMTKKGKASAAEEVFEKPEVKRAQTIVSMMESEPMTEDVVKVEKISKVKPVKVDRGNLADEKAKWVELNKKYGKDKALTYKMTEKYPSLAPLQHKVLGWGFILGNENDRLEVLFENGIRMLISNYKN